MVEVDLDSDNCNRIIEWYIHVFGTGKIKPNREDIRLLGKIETMRDAILLDEEVFRQMTKK